MCESPPMCKDMEMRRHTMAVAVGFFLSFLLTTACARAQDVAWTEVERAAGCAVVTRSATSPYPHDYRVAERSEAEGPVSVTLAQDEYEPVQIGVYALPSNKEPLKNVTIDVQIDLPFTVCELRHVKTWNDLQDDPVPHTLWPTKRLSDLSPGRLGVLWVTFHADADAKAGVHGGTIFVRVGDRTVTRALRVYIYPFVLPRPNMLYGFWYTDMRIPETFWNDRYQDLYMRDMGAHGMNSAAFSSLGRRDTKEPTRDLSEFDLWPLSAEMALAREAGLTRLDIPVLLIGSNYKRGKSTKGVNAVTDPKGFAAGLCEKSEENHWPEFLLGIGDEPSPQLTAQYEERTKPWRDTACRTYVALNAAAVYNLGLHYDNWFVLVGDITPAMQREAEWLDAQVCTYTFDLRGTNPRANRYYAGLYSWRWNLCGNCCWAYMANPKVTVTADGVIAGGLPGPGFALSSPKGPIGSVGYEGRREGVDDMRYLQTVEYLLSRVVDDTPTSLAARTWLAELRSKIDVDFFREFSVGEMWSIDLLDPNPGIGTAEYDEIRGQAADYSVALLEEMPEAGLPSRFERPRCVKRREHPWAPFQGKDAQTCINALKDASAATRRAAAYALAEMGPGAGEAVPALIECIGDEDVRMVAFRAIERIGLGARGAIPALAEALKDDDGFVRLGAAFALIGIGPESFEALLPAINDPFSRTAAIVIEWIDKQGLASGALSALMELLETSIKYGPRASATVAIGKMGKGGADAVPVLAKMLLDPRSGMRRYAARALGELGPVSADALPALETALNRTGEYSSVTSVMKTAIEKIRGTNEEGAAAGKREGGG